MDLFVIPAMSPIFYWFSVLASLLAATWALTTQLPCSISGTALLTQWTDPYFSQMSSALQSGYTMCPCLKRPKPCLMWVIAEVLAWCCVCVYRPHNYIVSSLSLLGAELQCTHPYPPTWVALHLLPPLPASQTLHSHRQQHPAHHKRIKVSPACQSLHRLLGGTQSLTDHPSDTEWRLHLLIECSYPVCIT